MEQQKSDIALFGNFGPDGGVERSFANVVPLWERAGYRIELVGYRDAVCFYPEEVEDYAHFRHLGTRGKLSTCLALWRYVFRHRPRVVVATGHISNLIAAAVARLPRPRDTRIFLNVQNDFVASGRDATGRKRARKLRQIGNWYRFADALLVTSQGIADNLAGAADLSQLNVHVIHNGVITDAVLARGAGPVDHPWLVEPRRVPVIVGAGGLRRQKDFHTLIRALSLLRREHEARLIIIGEGKDRQSLLDLARELGVEGAVDLPGFMTNPYAWIARADIFALSSLWEGFANVVAEALALGVPVVSTTCPSGPSEILAHGQHGCLVPPGDPQALASALAETLANGNRCEDPVAASEPFTAEYAAHAYLEAFGLGPPPRTASSLTAE